MILAVANAMYKYKWNHAITTTVLQLITLFTDAKSKFPQNYNKFKQVFTILLFLLVIRILHFLKQKQLNMIIA